VVALELAEQLRAEGRTILLVPMIDSRLPKRWIEARTLRVVQRLGRHMQLYAELQRGERAAYWRERWEWRVHHLRDAAERARVRLFGVDEPEGTVPDDPIPDANGAEPAQAEPEQPGRLNMSALQKAIWVCYLKYRPRRQSLPAALYICEDSRDHVDDGCLGWSAYLQGPLESTPVPGKHITVFRRPHVQVLARRLRDSLAYAHSRQTGG
jgi:thioesterase domain-containing protein